jgi:WD40 repeat protein
LFLHTSMETVEQWQKKATVIYTDGQVFDKVIYCAKSNTLITAGGKGNKAYIRNMDDESLITVPNETHWKPVLHPNGGLFVMQPDVRTITLVNTSGETIASYSCPKHDGMERVRFSKDGNELLLATKNVLSVLDVQTFQSKNLFPFDCDLVFKPYFFPNRQTSVFIACKNNAAQLWDRISNTVTIYSCMRSMHRASLHPDGRYVAGCVSDGVPYVYDLTSEREVCLAQYHHTSAIQYNKQGTHLLTRYNGGNQAHIWQQDEVAAAITARKGLHKYVSLHNSCLRTGCFNPRGDRIMTQSKRSRYDAEDAIFLWDVNGSLITRIPTSAGQEIYKARFDGTGEYIVGRQRACVTLWKKCTDK